VTAVIGPPGSESDLLRRLRFRRISVRPRCPDQDVASQQAHKKTLPPTQQSCLRLLRRYRRCLLRRLECAHCRTRPHPINRIPSVGIGYSLMPLVLIATLSFTHGPTSSPRPPDMLRIKETRPSSPIPSVLGATNEWSTAPFRLKWGDGLGCRML
jgi:hypothetical protein